MVTFSNVVGMPLPLLESLISGLFGQQAAEAQVRGASFLFLCNVAQSVTMWSLAGPMLRHGGPFARPHEDGSQSGIILESSTRSDQPPPDEGVGRGRRPKIVWRAPKHSRLTTVEHGAMQPSEEDPSVGAKLEAAMDAEEVQSAARPPRTPSTLWGRIRASPFIHGMLAVRNAINRPAAASLMGILVGCTPLRYVFVEEAAPMRWLIDSLELLGTGGIPLIIFVLGATLSKGGGNGGSVGDMPRAAVVATLLAKLVLVPVLNICLIYACTYAGVLTRGIDGLLPLTMVIVGASPTAMNISMIATMQGTGHREVAMLMFYQYVLAIVTVSLFASVGLLLFLT
jgi:predicted permease